MKIRILRRRGLGNTSTKGIKDKSQNDIEIIRNDREIPQDTDLLIRWGCTSQFPAHRTLNKAESIKAVNNKAESRKILQEAGVRVPKLYENIDDVEYPCIMRNHFHSQGKYLKFCNNLEELAAARLELKERGDTYTSEYIEKDQEFGVFIFNNRIWSVIEKVPKVEDAQEHVAWNVAQGTHKFQNVRWSEWPIEVCKEALDAVKCFNIDFCRVDLIVKDGVPYVLELNSAHSLTSDYRHESFAKCLDWYIENGKVQNELQLDGNITYKSIIHPALRENKLGKNL